ncbi:hypothetical protein BPUN_0016 [Candidatus Paraburkholderia kirkii]|nr:hypothetical protein BPUN_0016 [Candidatus Paraburkholderia kirkii]
MSSLAQVLEADFTNRNRPTRAQIFERFSLHARCNYHGRELIGFPIGADPDSIHPFETLEVAFNEWVAFERHPDDTYVDTHCWTFTPASFELIVRDLIFLKVIQLELMEVVEGGENEFYVHLGKPPSEGARHSREDFYRKRAELMRRVLDESSPSLAAQLAETTSQLQSQNAHYQTLLSQKETQLVRAEEARAHAEYRVETMLNSKS